MTTKKQIFAILSLAIGLVVAGNDAAAKEAKWQADMDKFQKQDETTAPVKGGIVFVGSSSIRGWNLQKFFPDLPVLNRGFGGSRVHDVIDYFDNVVTPYEPKTVVFYSGDNDIAGGMTTTTVFENVKTFVDLTHKKFPNTKIILLPPKPSISRWKLWPAMKEVGDAQRELANADELVIFVDIASPMLGPDGTPKPELFKADKLHMTDDGYTIWSDLVRPHLQDVKTTAPGEGAALRKAQPKVEITELKPGVWVHTSWYVYPTGARFPSNGLIVKEGDGLLLVDTAWGELATVELLKEIDRKIGLPVRSAVITHFHNDRLAGVDVLEARDIQVVAHPETQKLAEKTGAPVPDATLAALAEVDSSARVGTVEVYYPGAGHSAENLVVWVPAASVLFGGCAVRDAEAKSVGNLHNADLTAWPETIRRVKDRYPTAEIVVPGHGKTGGQQLLTHTLALLAKQQPVEKEAQGN